MAARRNVVVTRRQGGTELGLLLTEVVASRVENHSIGAEVLLYATDQGCIEKCSIKAQGQLFCASLHVPLLLRIYGRS